MEAFLEFEKPIQNLEKRLQELRALSAQEKIDFKQEMQTLEQKVELLIQDIFSKLTPWQRVQLSRHPNRPYTRDYIDALFPDFMELKGDRTFGDDQAILGGIASWEVDGKKIPILILGHQKGRTTKDRMERNFGMARPEGYRKAMRLMRLAEASRMPILTLIDTPGAYPGLEAEARGQAQAIAESIQLMFNLTVPITTVVIGEGGSGGALALAIGDRVLMTEYSVYSVISPESCASILWSDSTLAEKAAGKMRMSPPELLKMGVIDAIVPEPAGGAQRNWPSAFELLRKSLHKHFSPQIEEFVDSMKKPKMAAKTKKTTTKKKTVKKKPATLSPGKRFREERIEKFRQMGVFALAEAQESLSNGQDSAT